MKRVWFALFLLLFVIISPCPNAFAESNIDNVGKISKIGNKEHFAKQETGNNEHEDSLGTQLPLWSVIPFAGILLSIALFPLLAPRLWHHHFGKISAFWALLFAIPFLIAYKGTAFHQIVHIYLIDYIPFIILLWALYTVSGGILIKGTLKGSPAVNLLLLIIGTILSSWIGTTGSAMLLIRPLLRANKHRKHKIHIVVFFIFLVANIGGCLTPLGDPPLFLGFLHKVPFFWTLKLLPEMAFVSGALLVVFFIMDNFYYKKETIIEQSEETEPIKILGLRNFIFLAGIVASVLMSGLVDWGKVTIPVLGGNSIHLEVQNLARDGLMILMGVLSLIFTAQSIRKDNEFSWFPIKEVAYLFAGIFITIVPALAILQAGSKGSMAFLINAVEKPWHYFVITGSLSSFLDNAPTYLTFFNSALGKIGAHEGMVRAMLGYVPGHAANPAFITFLKAIATGAVFMGANTYIGNAPNFMIKSIAEESGIKMPSFFGYILKYSLLILVPIFTITALIFFD